MSGPNNTNFSIIFNTLIFTCLVNKLKWCYILLYFGSSHCRETTVHFSPHESISCIIAKNDYSFVPLS